MSNATLPAWLAAPLQRGVVHPAHALLLHGAGAIDRYDLGMALAQAWLCEADAADRRHGACGRCASCHLFASRTHPDFRIVLPESLREPLGWAPEDADGESGGAKSKAKPSREIRIDDVRAAIDWGQRTSARGRAKVLLLHPADAMNVFSANALLKTLEEPPGRLRLLLTIRDPDDLLPTVRSRCQRLRLPSPTAEEGRAWLEGQGVARADALLAAAGGEPRAALAWLDDGIDGEALQRFPADIRAGRAAAVASWPIARVVEGLQKLAHDLVACGHGATPRYFGTDALAPALRAPLPDAAALAEWSRELNQAARHDEHPWHAALRTEALVARAASLWQTPREAHSAVRRPLDTLPGR